MGVAVTGQPGVLISPLLFALLGSDGTGVGGRNATNLGGIASQFITQDAALNIGVDSNSGGHPVCSDGGDTYKAERCVKPHRLAGVK